ncbi:uncharacterized protein [Anabrus simplex]|uniref:uncharacterized protein isoform X2 n=1 Tax=Anabrus simplex TaxID=316456 RepID=UPI0035A26E25
MFPVRLSKLIREDSDLDPRSVCKQGEDELLNRLQLELNELRSPTWKKLKTTLEAEAISKVHIKRILNEFYSLADEFAVSAGQPASETATILFHLYFRKMKLKNKKSVHLIENYLFGADSSVISHRATKLMREITETLNSYTISSLDKDAVFDNDMFGCKLPYISLKRGGTFPFDTSDLCPMELQSASSDSEDSEEADHQSTAQLETPQLPEMVSPSRKRHVGIKELMVETGLVSLGRHLDSFALGLLPALSSSGDNLVIPVPFNQNKFHLALVAALTFFKSRQISRKNFSSNAKVLYLTSAAGLARGLAWDLEQCLTAIRIKTHCLVGRHSFTKSNVNGAHILVSTFKQWELFTRSREFGAGGVCIWYVSYLMEFGL